MDKLGHLTLDPDGDPLPGLCYCTRSEAHPAGPGPAVIPPGRWIPPVPLEIPVTGTAWAGGGPDTPAEDDPEAAQ